MRLSAVNKVVNIGGMAAYLGCFFCDKRIMGSSCDCGSNWYSDGTPCTAYFDIYNDNDFEEEYSGYCCSSISFLNINNPNFWRERLHANS